MSREEHARDRLAQLLLRKGVITQDQLNDAIELAEAGEDDWVVKCLEELEYVTERDVAVAFAELRGYDFVDLTEDMMNPNATALLPRELADDLDAVAVRVEDERLVVAMATPGHEREQKIREATGRDVKLLTAVFSVVYALLGKFYPRDRRPKGAVAPSSMLPAKPLTQEQRRRAMEIARRRFLFEAKKRELKLTHLPKEESERILAERDRLWKVYTSLPLPEEPSEPSERVRVYRDWMEEKQKAHQEWYELSDRYGLLHAPPGMGFGLEQIRAMDEAMRRAREWPPPSPPTPPKLEPDVQLCTMGGCDRPADVMQEFSIWPWFDLKEAGLPPAGGYTRVLCENHTFPEGWEDATQRLSATRRLAENE